MNAWRRSGAIALLTVALSLGACDFLMTDLSRGKDYNTGEPDADVGEFCPDYPGDNICCTPDDWCMYADDGFCDCDGYCDWEVSDCAEDTDTGTSDADSDTDTDADADSGAPDGGDMDSGI